MTKKVIFAGQYVSVLFAFAIETYLLYLFMLFYVRYSCELFFFNFQDFRVQRLIARINLNLQLTFLKRNSENAMVIAHSSFHLFFEIYTRKTKLHNEMGVEMLWKFEMKCSNGI